MEYRTEADTTWVHISLGLGGVVTLYLIQLQNYLLFHSLVELASILVAFALFIVVWNAREQLDNAFLTVLGIAYLFIGGLDLLHTLAYSGMGVFPSADANLPTQLWIFARYVEAVSLLAAGLIGYLATQRGTLAVARNPRTRSLIVLGYALVTLLGLLSIFASNTFPQAYIEGQGLTQFKILSEYVIIGLLTGALVLLYTQRTSFDSRVFTYLTTAILFTIAAEFAFTLYVNVYGLSNAIGHFFKLGSFFLVYLAVVKTGIREPQRTLYRTLASRERDLRQYHQTVDSAIDLLAAVDTDHNYLFANPQYCHYHGVNEHEIHGTPLRSVVGPDEYSSVRPRIDAALQGEESRRELTRSTPALGERVLDVQWFPIFDADDAIRGVGAAMRDITAQKETERQLQTLISNLPGIVYQCDNDRSWPMDYVNGQCQEITGYTAADIETGEVSWGRDIIHPADQDTVWSTVQDAISRDEPFEMTYRIHTRAGDLRWVWEQGRQINTHESEQTVLEGFITDITEQTQLEQHLRDAKDRYESLFTSITDAILVADTDRRIMNCNPAFTELFGYDLDAIRGNPTTTVYATGEDPPALGEILQRHPDEANLTQTIRYKKRSGQTFPGETTVFSLQNAEDEIVGSIQIIRDISDREDRLTQLQNVDRVLRHNFNNELNIITGYADQITTTGTGDIVRYAERIQLAGNRLAATVGKEREITKFLADQPPITELDITSLCTQVVDQLSTEYPAASITTSIPAGMHAQGPVQIKQAIQELLTNSILHSPSETPAVSLTVETAADHVRITVRDTNPPIPDIEQDILAGDEQTQLYHGSGMGLWLVSYIVKYANGVLTFHTDDHGGNTVTMELPATSPSND